MAHLTMFIAIVTLAIAVYASGDDIVMPPACAGQSYCTVPPDDYKDRVGDIDGYIVKNKYWAGLQPRNIQKYLVPSVVYDENNCGYETRTERPYIISALVNKTDSKTNKLVVQSESFVQEIQTTKCKNKEISCFDEIKAQQNGIETYCDERYSIITLYVYEDGQIYLQPFPIPVSCACRVQFINMK